MNPDDELFKELEAEQNGSGALFPAETVSEQ
jgi:hypothetical protein